MEIYDIVRKLIGPIEPLGDSSRDDKRLANLKNTIDLVDKLLGDISTVASWKNHYAGSISKAGKCAAEFIDAVHGAGE